MLGSRASVFQDQTSAAAAEAMLRFIYTGDLHLTCTKDVPLLHHASNELVPLLHLAKQYELNDLFPIVANLLVEGLTVENVKDRSQALKLHKEHPGVTSAWKQLLKKVKDDEDLLATLM